jgi:hypothetical protein
LEKQFQQQVKAYFDQPGLVDSERQNVAKQLLDQQEQVRKLIVKAQKQIQNLMNQEERSHKAMSSYLQSYSG